MKNKSFMRRTNQNIVLSKTELNRIKKDIAKQATTKSVVLMIACIMEEPPIEGDPDKIVDIFETIERWTNSMDEEHLINVRKVCDIIKEYTGLEITWE